MKIMIWHSGWLSSLGYSIVSFVISHILSSMLEINVYSIMDSKVFGVIIGFNFLLTIVEQKFNDCKHAVEVEMIQLVSMGGENENWFYKQQEWSQMQKVEKVNENNKQLEMV